MPQQQTFRRDTSLMLDTRMNPPPCKLPDYNYPVSPKENMKLIVEHKVPYWVPNMAIDMQMTFCPADLERPGMLMESGYDWFGLFWEYIDTVGAQMVKPGGHLLDDPSKWKEMLKFPNLDKIDFSVGAEEAYKKIDKDKATFYVMQNGIWERLMDFAQTEDAFAFLIEDPESAREYFDAMADFKCKIIDKLVKEWIPIDCIISSDDWGTQIGTFFSPQVYEDLIYEPTKKIADCVHGHGMWLCTHCCGKVQSLVPYMVKFKSDMWEGQNMNDLDMVKKEYGKEISLRLTADRYVLERTDITKDEVEAFIRDFVERYGYGGGLLGMIRVPSPFVYEAACNEMYRFSREFYGK